MTTDTSPIQIVTETADVPMPAEKVWSVIGNFDDPRAWATAVSAARVEGSGAGRTRYLTIQDREIAEVLVAAEPFSYTYRVTSGGQHAYADGTVAVVPVGASSSRIELTSRYRLQPGGDEQEAATARAKFLRGSIKAMLRALGTNPA